MLPVFGVFTLMLLDIVSYGWYPEILDGFLNILPWAWFGIWFASKKKQENFVQAIIQGSFLVFIFGVLSYTIFWFPITNLVKSIISGNWVSDMTEKLEMISRGYDYRGIEAVLMNLGVNLVPFKKFVIYSITHVQVVGNLVMLLPLGFYLPILYKKANSYKKVLSCAFLISLFIELSQFIFSFITAYSSTFHAYYQRSFDVDDLILNTAGAVIGYGIYNLFNMAISKIKNASKTSKPQEAS